jgi:carboxymethylenebutenolidase
MAASFHGAALAAEGDGVHRKFSGVEAKIYVGIAGVDPMFDGAEEGRLAAALREAGTDHTIETYPGAYHGFVMADLPMYNEAACARHWDRLLGALRESAS